MSADGRRLECTPDTRATRPASPPGERDPPAARPGALSVETVTSEAGLEALRDEWTALFERAGEGLPFATHEWASAWWRHLHRDDRLLRDSLQMRVVRGEDGAVVAIAPLMRTERPARGPLRARSLHYLGTDPNLTELRRGLVEPADEARVVRVLARHLEQADPDWDWLVLSGLKHALDVGAELVAGGHAAWSGETNSYVLALPDTWDELRAGLKRNIRESLRKCYNSLVRTNSSFELNVAESPREVASALELFTDLHRRRATLATTVAHADCFADPAARAFLFDVCLRLAEQRHTRVFVLRVGSQPVAARVAFQFGDQLYFYYSGYDPAWAQFSVMTTTLAEALKWSIAHGIREANLSTGRDVSKTRWGPREHTYREVTLVRPELRSRLAYRTYRWGFGARGHGLVRSLAGSIMRRPSR